jgi:spore coat polysaccharide biosynthesis predicted glycosyltransferase SpsG
VASACLPDPVHQTLLEEGVQIIDLPSVGAITDPLLKSFEQADWVIIDSYVVPTQIRELAKELCPHTGMIDDFANSVRPVNVDLLIDQNLGVHLGYYSNDRVDRFLLGTRYALLRRFFRSATSTSTQTCTRGLRILFLTGGSRHPTVSNAFRWAANDLKEKGHYVTSIGSGLRSQHVGFDRLPLLMAEADLAITAAGSTCWELAWSGIPIVAVPTAHNQEQLAEALASHGIAVTVNPSEGELTCRLTSTVAELISAPARRKEMATTGRKIVDGQGAERVAAMMLQAT